MKYDFDRVIERAGTSSVKWEFHQSAGRQVHWDRTRSGLGDERVLPLWVADMDFACPQPVVDALIARAQHPIYGYTDRTESYYQAVVGWMERKQGWYADPKWICTTPGVVSALNMLVRTFVAPGDKVVVQPPVYYPFYGAIRNNGGEIIENPLAYEHGKYCMDFVDLERKVQDTGARMLILCSPHNPVGRVWSQHELTHLAEICLENNVLLVSDEIHGDLILPGNSFTSVGGLGDQFLKNAIICTAPSKTFNLAGLHTSNIIIPNPELRSQFQKTQMANGLGGVNPFGLAALEAAYKHGEEWLTQVLDYIQENLCYLQGYIHESIPEITVVQPEGTYLVWVDCRRLGLDAEGLQHLMMDEARVFLDEGAIFGKQGDGFERVNIACPRSLLAEALLRIKLAVDRRLSRC